MSDIFRRQPRTLSRGEQDVLDSMKAEAEELYSTFESLGVSRELSVAKTKLEEAVMWATKHITR